MPSKSAKSASKKAADTAVHQITDGGVKYVDDAFSAVDMRQASLHAEDIIDDEGKELWMIRLPSEVDANVLGDTKIKIRPQDYKKVGKVLGSFAWQSRNFELRVGDSAPLSQIVPLFTSNDDTSKLFAAKPMVMQLVMVEVESNPQEGDTTVEPVAKPTVISAYSSVPKKNGLRVRFHPYGYGSRMETNDPHAAFTQTSDAVSTSEKKKKKEKKKKRLSMDG